MSNCTSATHTNIQVTYSHAQDTVGAHTVRIRKTLLGKETTPHLGKRIKILIGLPIYLMSKLRKTWIKPHTTTWCENLVFINHVNGKSTWIVTKLHITHTHTHTIYFTHTHYLLHFSNKLNHNTFSANTNKMLCVPSSGRTK